MLSDAAVKYLSSSVALAPMGAQQEAQQLAALRPQLRQLATSAAGQLRTCLLMADSGAVLTHTSSLRALCLLLKNVLALTGEVLEPLLLLPPMEGHAAAEMAGNPALNPAPLPAVHIHAAAAQAAAELVGAAPLPALAAEQQEPLQPALQPPQQQQPHQPLQQQGQQPGQHHHQQQQQGQGPSPAAAAAAVVAGAGGPAWAPESVVPLAKDARMLMTVSGLGGVLADERAGRLPLCQSCSPASLCV